MDMTRNNGGSWVMFRVGARKDYESPSACSTTFAHFAVTSLYLIFCENKLIESKLCYKTILLHILEHFYMGIRKSWSILRLSPYTVPEYHLDYNTVPHYKLGDQNQSKP